MPTLLAAVICVAFTNGTDMVSHAKVVAVALEVNPAETIFVVWIAFDAKTLPVTIRLAVGVRVEPIPTNGT
jgi:hypothetical protein